MTWRHGAASDVGRVRAQNEDAFVADGETGTFVVADGMGGHAAGEVASEMAVHIISAALRSFPTRSTVAEVRQRLNEAIGNANRAVFEDGLENPSRTGMGTTVTALVLLPGGSYVIGQVGDSRAYLLRDGTLRQLTEDHTYVQQLVNRGRLTSEQARLHPRSSLLTRALGTAGSVALDLFDGEARAGDRFLLASDGLTGMLTDQELAEIMRERASPDEPVARLIEAANSAGGNDNITVVLVEVVEAVEEAD